MKAKNMFILSTLLIASVAAASGTGVGSGGNDSRDQYLAKLMGRKIKISPQTLYTEISQWCSDVVIVLKKEKARAAVQLQRKGNAVLAEQILVDAMLAAAESLDIASEQASPVTKSLIDNGLFYSQALDATLGSAPLATQTKLNFLFSYVDFIIQKEKSLDRPYFIPYRYRYKSCWSACGNAKYSCWEENCEADFNFKAFAKEYVDFGKEQIEFVLDKFTEQDGRGRIVPLGSPIAFLKLAELVSKQVAQDLSNNLYAYAHACSIRELEALSANLEAFNLYGDNSIYYNTANAVQAVHDELRNIANSLNGCRR